jgi:hypothetical protein
MLTIINPQSHPYSTCTLTDPVTWPTELASWLVDQRYALANDKPAVNEWIKLIDAAVDRMRQKHPLGSPPLQPKQT